MRFNLGIVLPKKDRLAMFRRIIKDQRGAILAEYVLLATLIAVVCVVAVTTIGVSVLRFFESDGLLGAF
jgi:Flp pilus assembly pilin Flp